MAAMVIMIELNKLNKLSTKIDKIGSRSVQGRTGACPVEAHPSGWEGFPLPVSQHTPA